MPPWSIDEILTAENLGILPYTPDELRKRFNIVGGCVRRVFSKVSLDKLKENLRDEAKGTEPNKMNTLVAHSATNLLNDGAGCSLRNYGKAGENLAGLVHVQVIVLGSRAYSPLAAQYIFPSHYAAALVFDQLKKVSTDTLQILVRSYLEGKVADSATGWMVERLLHRDVALGGTCVLRDLKQRNRVWQIELQTCKPLSFYGLKNVPSVPSVPSVPPVSNPAVPSVDQHVYYMAHRPNEPAIDGFFPHLRVCLQMTVSNHHGINYKRICEIMRHLVRGD